MAVLGACAGRRHPAGPSARRVPAEGPGHWNTQGFPWESVPVETLMFTADPRITKEPEPGLWLTTVPCGSMQRVFELTVPTVSPAPRIRLPGLRVRS